MKLYTINKLTYSKNKELKYSQPNLLYCSKNYAKIEEKMEKFVNETAEFFKENLEGFIGVTTGAYNVNDTPAGGNTNLMYSFISKDMCALIYITEIDIDTAPQSEKPLEKGDYVEINNESSKLFESLTGIAISNQPSLLRIMEERPNNTVLVMICSGSVDPRKTGQNVGYKFDIPKSCFKRITTL